MCISALDALYGDYLQVNTLPKGDLDWVGTHVWKDVVQLQGPESQSPLTVWQSPNDV